MPPLLSTTVKTPVTVASCMPKQNYDRQSKLDWLDRALGETECDLFVTPQEWLGGHYIMKTDLHMDRDWIVDVIGKLAVKHNKHVAVGACCKTTTSGATEDLLYIDNSGALLGYHSKFALPSYDDMKTGGHGQLWPETSYKRRAMPIDMPKLRLRLGTVFCWEVFSQTLWSTYSFARCNLILHVIKFAPRGWLKNKKLEDGFKHIVGFGNAPKSQIWVDRLLMASRHQCMCPIAVSCNSWNLGEKMDALVGHVDEFRGGTELLNLPSIGTTEKIHTFSMLPEYYEGLDHHHSAGAFKAHVGSVEGFSEMGQWTMHGKIRRLEAQLLGDTARMDCILRVAVSSRQKKSTLQRALGLPKQRIPKGR